MRIMGLDYGSKTVGVALSDELLLTAQPKETIVRNGENKLRKTLTRIEELINENQVEKIVLGLPLMTDDSIGDRAQLCMDFAKKLNARTGLEVILMDERYTTTVAEEELEEMQIKRSDRKKYVDQLAACHILEDYLHNRNPEHRNQEK